jgi:hypothetical protein
MSLFKKTLAAAILSATAMSASAALTEVQTQTLEYSALTDWTTDLTFDLYDSSAFGGADLERVSISLVSNTLSDATFTATADSTFFGSTNVVLSAVNSLGATAGDLSVSTTSEFADVSSQLFLAAGETLEIEDLVGSGSSSNPMIEDAASLDLFSGAGTFDVTLSTVTWTTVNWTSGNVSGNNTTVADGTYTITYYVDDSNISTPPATGVPVPGTLALMGLGLIAVAARKKAKA